VFVREREKKREGEREREKEEEEEEEEYRMTMSVLSQALEAAEKRAANQNMRGVQGNKPTLSPSRETPGRWAALFYPGL